MYAFTANEGLQLSGGLTDTNTYSVVMTLQVDTDLNYYNKLFDFQQRASDDGLYVSGGQLELFPGPFGTDTVTANQDFQLRHFGTQTLPTYAVLLPLADGRVRVLGKYDLGKINDPAAFARFLSATLDKANGK